MSNSTTLYGVVKNGYLSTTHSSAYLTNTTLSSTRRANLGVAKVIVIVLFVASSYVLLMLVRHWFLKSRSYKESIATILCLFASVCSFIVSLNKLAELWIGGMSCAVYHRSATAVYGIGLALVYTTLWIRQRKLYSDDLLKNTVSKVSRVVSAAVIALIYLLLTFVFISFITILKFEKDYPPCHIVWYPLGSLILPLVIFFITSCFILQLLLFLLIVNPLRKGSSICRDVLCSTSKTDIHAMLKRLAVCACLCIFSTILLSIAILLDAVEIICIYWGNLVALDILINTLATTCCFVDWNQRVLPVLTFSTKKDNVRIQNSILMEEPPSERTMQTSFSSAETRSMLENNNGVQ